MDMRISNVYSAYSQQPVRSNAQALPRAGREQTDTDRVSLSAQAGDYQAARLAVANTPDIRTELVSRIQEMLDAGTYRVSAYDVAARIFQGLG